MELFYEGKVPEDAILAKPLPDLVLKNITSELLHSPLCAERRHEFYLSDNELALRWLLSEKRRVQLVYIDPPFGTGSVFHADLENGVRTISRSSKAPIGYEDTLEGKDFLEFLRVRLILLREVLLDSGLIFVHIGEEFGFHVKILLDEVFGRRNFVSHVSRIKSNPKNFYRKAPGNIKDMILIYSKTRNYLWNDVRIPYTEEEIHRLFPKTDPGTGRRYTTNPLHAPGETKNGPTAQPWRGMFPPKGRHWRYPPEVLEELDRQGLIEWSQNGVPRKKVFADELSRRGKRLQDIWEFKDPPYPSYPTEKSLELLKLIISLGSNPGDTVLDAFAGSGTTLIAASELERRSIGIDLSPIALKAFAKRSTQQKRILTQGLEIIYLEATRVSQKI